MTRSGPREASVIVLIGPLGSTSGIWDEVVPALARARRVIRLDLRGHGEAAAPPGPYDIVDLGRDILAAVDGSGARTATIAGISIGAMGALWVAAHAPERVDGLILACSATTIGTPAGWAARAALVRAEGMAVVAEAVSGRWVTPAWAAGHPDAMAGFREMVGSVNPRAYADWCGALARADLQPELAAITAPTLVIAGAEDPVLQPADVRGLADGIAGARLAIIPNAAHNPPLEQPQAMTKLILSHLAVERAEPARAGRP